MERWRCRLRQVQGSRRHHLVIPVVTTSQTEGEIRRIDMFLSGEVGLFDYYIRFLRCQLDFTDERAQSCRHTRRDEANHALLPSHEEAGTSDEILRSSDFE